MPNRLASETSPYLLQHANNPVDWRPWGPDALAEAKTRDMPIFLSIGYSACHWCHVMEHESFENPHIAQLLNERFICIKVDREERPDLDQIYMNAVQMMTGRGGWPMSVFLTPELKPFFGGTYWPPTQRMGMPGFDQVVIAVHDAWKNRRAMAVEQAETLTAELERAAAARSEAGELKPSLLDGAAQWLERAFDFTHGGFGQAPKFPHPMDLRLLLRLWKRNGREALRDMVTLTLDHMAAGGIYDQLAGGFHRYSVDERWLVPHFEKMLYDNGLLTVVYVEAFQATGRKDYAQVARETCDYLLREMTDAQGGFYSTQDADSEGVEGKFFVWTPEEIVSLLGEEKAKTFAYVYDVTPAGNFEEANILNRPKTLAQCASILRRDEAELRRELAESRATLLAAREKRIKPGLDDKVLVGWNGLAIDALAQAAGALGEPRYEQAARAAADFILAKMRRPDGRLLRVWRAGQAKIAAYLDDYASLALALVSLYEANFDERYVDEAIRLCEIMLADFADPDGGFFYTAATHESLIVRQRDVYDNATPSASALATMALLRLDKLTGRADFLATAESSLQDAAELMHKAPSALSQMLLAYDFYIGPTKEIVILGDSAGADTAAVLADLRRRFIPRKLVALRHADRAKQGSAALAPLFAGKTGQGAEPTVYVCEQFTCQAPIVGRKAVLAELDRLSL